MALAKHSDPSSAANELPELQIEPGFLPKLKERVRIAREIEKAQHAVKKSKHEKSWLQETAEAMDIDIDPDMMYVIFLLESDTLYLTPLVIFTGRLKNQMTRSLDPERRRNSGCAITHPDSGMNSMSFSVNR